MIRGVLTILIMTLTACAEHPASQHQLPIECLPMRDVPPPPNNDDDVAVDDDTIVGDPVTLLWLRLAGDPDCTPGETSSGLTEYSLAWRRDGVTRRNKLRMRRTVSISRDAGSCRVATTHEFLPALTDSNGIRNDWDLNVGLCGATVLHSQWASLQVAQIRMTAFSVAHVGGGEAWFPVQRTLPWAASSRAECDNPLMGTVRAARLRFRSVLTISMDDWLRVQSSALPVPIAWISIDVIR